MKGCSVPEVMVVQAVEPLAIPYGREATKIVSVEQLKGFETHTRADADLVVMATHGRSGVSRWIWGSVADRLLRSLRVPVLIVRAPGSGPEA